MKQVAKYEVTLAATFNVTMPINAVVLTAATPLTELTPCLIWALIDPDEQTTEQRDFISVSDDEDISDASPAYVATVMVGGQTDDFRHIFEV